jgi:prepilin-type processing-associated H-X9-DG protein
LLPHLEQTALHSAYNFSRRWDKQRDHIVDQVIPVFVCPSASHDNPYTVAGLEVFFDVGNTFGLSDFIFCKGVFDGWCLYPSIVPKDERGMFDASFLGGKTSFTVRASQITDGLSNTLAMGEGACGWPVCAGVDCSHDSGSISANAWAGQPNFADVAQHGLLMTSTFGSTIEPLNKRPVTQTVVDAVPGNAAGVFTCACSTDWNQTGRKTAKGQTSGFRSDHPGGAQFLYADGSVQFVQESVDLAVYRQQSTIQGKDE